MKTFNYCMLALIIIGAINWGLVGFLKFDLIATVFGDLTFVSRLIYSIVGIAGLYSLTLFGRIRDED